MRKGFEHYQKTIFLPIAVLFSLALAASFLIGHSGAKSHLLRVTVIVYIAGLAIGAVVWHLVLRRQLPQLSIPRKTITGILLYQYFMHGVGVVLMF